MHGCGFEAASPGTVQHAPNIAWQVPKRQSHFCIHILFLVSPLSHDGRAEPFAGTPNKCHAARTQGMSRDRAVALARDTCVAEVACVCSPQRGDEETFFVPPETTTCLPFLHQPRSRSLLLCHAWRCLAAALRSTCHGGSKTCAAAASPLCRGTAREGRPSRSPAVVACMSMTHGS